MSCICIDPASGQHHTQSANNQPDCSALFTRNRVPGTIPSVPLRATIPASHPSYSRNLPDGTIDDKVGDFPTVVGLWPNCSAEATSWQFAIWQLAFARGSGFSRRGLTARRGYLRIASSHDGLRRIRRPSSTDAVPSALSRRESRPIPAGNTAPSSPQPGISAGTNHS